MLKCSTAVRVRYAEVDRLGNANSARYFEWFELGRSDVMRAAGHPYGELEERGFFAPVVEAHCRYISRIGYDESLRIETTVAVLSAVRLRFDFRVFAEREEGEVLAAEGHTENAIVGASGRPVRLDADVLAAMRGV